MTLALRFAALSNVGLRRDGNEDSAYAGPRVVAVADGMGGHAAGEVASAVAIASIARLDEDDPGPDLLSALRSTATAANDSLREMVAGDPSLAGMGTTLTALLFAGSRLGVLHVGDSRCYLLRDGELHQITHDHTLVQTLVDEGRISEDEAHTHPQRSLITRVLDGRDSVELDLSVREARAGDRYLLCSDGLTGPVGRLETLQDALEIAEPAAACERLVDLALRGGAPDNVTVVVADVVDAEAAPPAPVVGGAAAEQPQVLPDGVGAGAAARARAATRGAAPDPVAPAGGEPAARRRSRAPLLLGGGAAVVLLAVAAVAGWLYLRSQYYVGLDGDRVAIFQGVEGTVAGVALNTVAARTDLQVDRLGAVARMRVESGIVAQDRPDAEAIVQRLRSESAQPCTSSPGPSPSATPSAGPASGQPAPTPGALAPGAATPGAATPGAATSGAATPTPGAPVPTVPAPNPTAPGATPSPPAPGSAVPCASGATS